MKFCVQRDRERDNRNADLLADMVVTSGLKLIQFARLAILGLPKGSNVNYQLCVCIEIRILLSKMFCTLS